jgi:hypothetical protein
MQVFSIDMDRIVRLLVCGLLTVEVIRWTRWVTRRADATELLTHEIERLRLQVNRLEQAIDVSGPTDDLDPLDPPR